MKIRTKVRAGGVQTNRSAKKLTVKRPRGMIVRTAVRAGGITIKQS